MSSAPNGWQTPRTVWAAGEGIPYSALNRIESNIDRIENSNRTLTPAQPTGNTSTLRSFLDQLAYQISKIIKRNWYEEIGRIYNFSGCVGGSTNAIELAANTEVAIYRVRILGLSDHKKLILKNAVFYAETGEVRLKVNVGNQSWVSTHGTLEENPNFVLLSNSGDAGNIYYLTVLLVNNTESPVYYRNYSAFCIEVLELDA